MAGAAEEFDLVVIGAGSGGVRAARVAAELGARVAVVEAGALGGTCVNAGCIPKKLLVLAAEFTHALHDAPGFGWAAVQPAFDWRTLVANKDREIARLNHVYLRLLTEAGVAVIHGRAELTGAHTVQVGTRTLHARHLLIATGGRPKLPDVVGCEFGITSDDAFHLPAMPRRVVIVGAGYVALEFAGVFHGLGAEVQIVHRRARVLPDFDHEIGEHLVRELRKQGIGVRENAVVASLARGPDGIQVALADGGAYSADAVLLATGRVPNTRGLGLERAGIHLGPDGAVVVDEYSRTSLPHVFAVGDCTGRTALTPVAIADGQAAAHTMFGTPRPATPLELVPTALFSQPPLATVGLAEHEARARYGEIDVYRSTFTPLKHRLSGRDTQTLVKLVVERASQRVLGCHMVGEGAPEIMQGFAVALHCGATKAQFDATLGIHPTAAEELVTLRTRSA